MRKALIVFMAVFIAASCSKKAPLPVAYEPEELFRQGNEELEKKNYEEARQSFEDIKRRDEGQGYAPLAQLRIADSYVREETPELAVDEYKEFLRDYPSHKYASYAQYQIGMVYYNLIKGPDRGHDAAVRAVEAFETLNSLYPRNPYRETVELNMERARQVLAEHEFMVGDFYFKKGTFDGAIGRLEGLLRDFPDYKGEDEVLYRLAVGYKALGMEAKAEEYLRALSGGYPESSLVGKTREKFEELSGE